MEALFYHLLRLVPSSSHNALLYYTAAYPKVGLNDVIQRYYVILIY